MDLLVFPLRLDSTQLPFITDTEYGEKKEDYVYSPIIAIDWRRITADYSRLFLQEVKNNLAKLRLLEERCRNETSVSCQKLLDRIYAYNDTLERDEYAFRLPSNSIYVVLLHYHGAYQGHIYTWFSPNNNYQCFAMGIRGRVDSLFDSSPRSFQIAPYLLEGVRRLACCQGRREIIITLPMPVMIRILSSLGFRPASVYNRDIGTSIYDPDEVEGAENLCQDCWSNVDILTPFIDIDSSISFRFSTE